MLTKAFANYRGSTAGNMIGPVVLPPYAECWQLPWSIKKEVYKAANLVGVCAKLPEDMADIAEANEPPKPRTQDSVEPVFYHGSPPALYDELLNFLSITAVIDLTPGDGTLALEAFKKNLLYVGFPFSDEHKVRLEKHLENRFPGPDHGGRPAAQPSPAGGLAR